MAEKWRGFATMTLTAVISAAIFWLLRDHWRHALGFLGYAPFLLFFSCPLMHLFMHHGHGLGREGHDHMQASRSPPPAGSGVGPKLSS